MKKLRSRFTFPGLSTEWLYPETATLTHSGGTAPVSHRTSLLGPRGHLRLLSMPEPASRLQQHAGDTAHKPTKRWNYARTRTFSGPSPVD
jgi:hypothetical protein